jgi:hypothetical protein
MSVQNQVSKASKSHLADVASSLFSAAEIMMDLENC